MEYAMYGRMNVGKCVKRNLGYVGCAVEVRDYMDTRCSGRRTCMVKVVDLALAEVKPCPDDVTSHLEVSYNCVDVLAGHSHQCQSRRYLQVPTEGGMLASVMAVNHGFGTSQCPWVIDAQPGQRVNLTLHNYARTTPKEAGNKKDNVRPDACYEFAVVKDGNAKKSIVGCARDSRQSHVYTSTSNEVEIYVLDRIVATQSVYFMLEYTVLGCPNIPRPRGSFVQRHNDKLMIRCNSTGETWYLTCKGMTWVGDHGNCTDDSTTWRIGFFHTDTSFPYGILIVVAVGVALGVFFGGLLLFTVNLYMKRKHRQREAHTVGAHGEDMIPEDKLSVGLPETDYSTGYSHKTRDLPTLPRPLPNPTSEGTLEHPHRRMEQTQYIRGNMPPPPYPTQERVSRLYESPTFS